MSATNSTLNYQLPQFIATDKPAWLVDFNGAMSDIDTAIKEAKTAGDNAQTTANTNATNIQTLDGTVTSQGTAIGTLTTSVAGNTGSINTINSLIGNGEPTTTDKTIIGAINEINAKVGDVDAEDVAYTNTTSHLTATNVQAAIDELATASPSTPAASAVTYSNTTSGLTATNVQAAIDEVNGKVASVDLNLSDAHTPTVTPVSGLSVTSDYTEAHILLNADKSLGKIYGGVEVAGTLSSGAGGWVKVFTLSNTGIETASQYNIVAGSCNVTYGSADHARIFRMVFNTDGSVDFEVKMPASNNITAAVVPLYPCLYILKNLGD